MDIAPESVLAWRKRLGQAVWLLQRAKYFDTILGLLASNSLFLLYLILLAVKNIFHLAAVVLILVLAATLSETIRLVVTRFITSRQLPLKFIESNASWRDQLVLYGIDNSQVRDENVEGNVELLKQVTQALFLEFGKLRVIRVFRYISLLLLWFVLSAGAIVVLGNIVDYFRHTKYFNLEGALMTWLEYPSIVIMSIVLLTLIIDKQAYFNAVLFQAVKTELGPDYPSESSMRLPGTLAQRIDHLHCTQHLGFFLLFWIVGLLPFGIATAIWAVSYLDDSWQAVPTMAATACALALAAVDLFSWRRDLRLTLAKTNVAVQITDEVLNQTTQPVGRLSAWRQFVNSIDSPRDPAYTAAAKLGAQLPRRMPEDQRRLALWRLWTLTLLFVVLCGVIVLACWPVVGAYDGGFWSYLYAVVVGGGHLALMLGLVRTYLPQIELLDYLKQHL